MSLRQIFYRALRRQGYEKAEARDLAIRAASAASEPIPAETLKAWAS